VVDALLTALDRALPTPPGKASVVQQLLGLQIEEVRPRGVGERHHHHLLLLLRCPCGSSPAPPIVAGHD
jgi:hypothetical protein